MRILMLTRGNRANPASRLRFYAYEPYLRAAGHRVEIRPLFDDGWPTVRKTPGLGGFFGKALYSARKFAERWLDLQDVRAFDLVVVEHQLFPYEPGLLEAWLFRQGVPVSIEFDDAIYETPLHRGKLQRTLTRADLVVVGNRTLSTFASEASTQVRVVPTVIDMARPHAARERALARHTRRRVHADEPLVLGWIGLPYNLPSLRLIERPLARFAAEMAARKQKVCLRIVSSEPLTLPGIRCEFAPWSESKEYELIADFDAGLMPLFDTPYERGKCAFKLLQSMAAGTLAIGSPVGMNGEVIRHGVNGLLCTDEDQWLAAFRRLANDPHGCARMAAVGAATVDRDFDLAMWGPRVVAMYEAVAARRNPSLSLAPGPNPAMI